MTGNVPTRIKNIETTISSKVNKMVNKLTSLKYRYVCTYQQYNTFFLIISQTINISLGNLANLYKDKKNRR